MSSDQDAASEDGESPRGTSAEPTSSVSASEPDAEVESRHDESAPVNSTHEGSSESERGPPSLAEEGSRPPKRRRQKRKKKRPAPAPKPARPKLAPDGTERPAFLLDFPDDPRLERLIAAFEAGDFRTVRNEAPKLAEQSDDPVVRDAALELRERLEPDPLIKYLLIASVVLLVFLTFRAYAGPSH